jgi:5-methylthioadenosine/S-adenosylhomocysteine deaminase
MQTPVDLLITARWTLPIEPAGVCLEHHAVAVDQGKIVDLLPAADAEARYLPRERVDLGEQVLMPGLVNAHTHAAMSLLRGYADDLPLERWLTERIWPAEAAHVSPDFVRDGTLLAAAEMVCGGVTCASDMYFFPGAAAEAFLAMGMRAALGLLVIDFPTRYGSGPDDYLDKGLAARDRLRGESLLSFTMAPHAPYSVSDAALGKVAALAEELDLPVHMHVHETADEVQTHLARHGCRPLARLERLGLVSPRLMAVHAVHLDEAEIALLARHGVSVVHCPASNLKLASGLAPAARLVAAGVNVAIGTDGAASNNRLDVLGETRLAALLAKGVSGDATAWSAHEALRAATLAGARALGLEDRIGSITAGKRADLIAINLAHDALRPGQDPASQIVYAADRHHVQQVWIDGRQRVRDGQLIAPAAEQLDSLVCMWQNRLV